MFTSNKRKAVGTQFSQKINTSSLLENCLGRACTNHTTRSNLPRESAKKLNHGEKQVINTVSIAKFRILELFWYHFGTIAILTACSFRNFSVNLSSRAKPINVTSPYN